MKSSSVEVAINDGVTLAGQVSDDAVRLAAEQVATKTPGMKTVVDRTTMAPPPLPPLRLLHRIRKSIRAR